MIYLANPHPSLRSAMVADTIASVEVSLPAATAKWSKELYLPKGIQNLKTPSGGDWVILLRFHSNILVMTANHPPEPGEVIPVRLFPFSEKLSPHAPDSILIH